MLPDIAYDRIVAADICRGTSLLLQSLDCAVLGEVCLPSGRRADLMALCAKGGVTIVEVKSSVVDFRTDSKWPDYLPWCDRFFFAVSPAFPAELIPDDCGLIVADRWGAEMLREPATQRIGPHARRALTLGFARAAAFRHGGREAAQP